MTEDSAKRGYIAWNDAKEALGKIDDILGIEQQAWHSIDACQTAFNEMYEDFKELRSNVCGHVVPLMCAQQGAICCVENDVTRERILECVAAASKHTRSVDRTLQEIRTQWACAMYALRTILTCPDEEL